jgi:FAD/FMN-containing dehydrogenase
MTANTFLLGYAIWDDEDDDERNESWLRGAMAGVEPHSVGRYVAEADLLAAPSRATQSFTVESWARLQALKHQHDPNNLFQPILGLDLKGAATP